MWASKHKSVNLTHFESKSSGIDSGDEINSSERSSTSEEVSPSTETASNHIAIIGSGDFGRALALRMVQNGLVVKIGSRNPDRNR